MTHHPDTTTLEALEADHLRFDQTIHGLLQRPSAGVAAWAAGVHTLAGEIQSHLKLEEGGFVSALETNGGEATASALREGYTRIRNALTSLDAAADANRFDPGAVRTLADELREHAKRADVMLREWQVTGSLPEHHPVATEAASIVSGMVVGATMGALAGPIGAAGGAIAGGLIAGAAAAAATLGNAEDERHDEQLDKDIGVSGGHLGEASPNAPKAKIGAFSSAAVGGHGRDGDENDDAEGPITLPKG